MRIGSTLLLVWVVIGLLAAVQRGYFRNSNTTCAKTGTIMLTVVAGPLNYAGMNPKVAKCHTPQPSK